MRHGQWQDFTRSSPARPFTDAADRFTVESGIPDAGGRVATVFVFILIVLVIFGGTVWVVLNRPVAGPAVGNDRASARLLTASALALAIGLLYGLGGLFGR